MRTTVTRQGLRLASPFGMFGPTFQGEGSSLGQRALFVRTMLCNLTCRDCDTKETWDASQYDLREGSRWVEIDEIMQWVFGHGATNLIVITGGEPLIQQHALIPLATGLAQAGRRVEIETNGTLPPASELTEAVTQFNVSPKLSGFGTGMPHGRRLVPGALRAFAASGKAVWKFVVDDPRELGEIAELEHEYGLAPVWVMPSGMTHHAILQGLRRLADPVRDHGWNLTPRLHIEVWGNERGR